jgi:hypothetical protein
MDNIQHRPGDASAEAAERRKKWVDGPFAKMNRNLGNYPLARSRHSKWQWTRGPKSGRWIGELPGSERIQFGLPKDANPKYHHPPSPFEINVILRLAARAQG